MHEVANSKSAQEITVTLLKKLKEVKAALIYVGEIVIRQKENIHHTTKRLSATY
jgi:hypothetical protein